MSTFDRTPSPALERALEAARRLVRLESAAIAALEPRLDDNFLRAVEIVALARGRVVTSGIGKSGLVAQRLAATLTSIGTPAVFVHPVEALHGDLGLVGKGDVAVLVSKSGATRELESIIPTLKLLGLPILGILAGASSPLAQACDLVLATGSPEEGCPFDLVPTSSSAAAQALGDALAMAVLEYRGLKREDFTFFHPGGAIGRSALMRVRDLMRSGADLPVCAPETPLREALHVILDKKLGLVVAVGEDSTLRGIVTDGDFKRLLLKDAGLMERAVGEVMTRSPRTIPADAWVLEAVRRMEENPGGAIMALVVVDKDDRVLGVIHLHDCLQQGL